MNAVEKAIVEATLAGAELPRPDRLPPHLVAAATCLQMEDHHVRLHSVGRSTMHFTSLRDAIAQVGPARGLQVHRSWWVAADAVCEIVPHGRSVILVLRCGVRVPVSRSRLPAIRAAGWLASCPAAGAIPLPSGGRSAA